ncbi:hypothetical protein AVW11_35170 [Streptomyces amritsarensis]|uniref:Uncharacterized protein n=1 Tax=Streptomyces amritsarensis TaxID=681158 RepID=A0ABX3FR63_9ACTN|nr:hypothetical protein AVW11_35170 [Streptomyces amritsarensis]
MLAGTEGATHRFRLDYLWLSLAGEDQLSGWSTDAMAELAAREFGASCAAGPRRTGLLAALGEVRVIDRFRSGSGGLRVTVAWPSGLRGAAAERLAAGVVRQGWAYAGPREGCVCTRHDCGGIVPVSGVRSTGTRRAR